MRDGEQIISTINRKAAPAIFGVSGIDELFGIKIKDKFKMSGSSQKTKINQHKPETISLTATKAEIQAKLLSIKGEDKTLYVETEPHKQFKGSITPHDFLRKSGVEDCDYAEDLMEVREQHWLRESATLKDAFDMVVGAEGGTPLTGSSLPVVDNGKLIGSVAEAAIMAPVIGFIIKKEKTAREILENVDIAGCEYRKKFHEINTHDPWSEILTNLKDLEEGDDDTHYVIDESRQLKGSISSIDILAYDPEKQERTAEDLLPDTSPRHMLSEKDSLLDACMLLAGSGKDTFFGKSIPVVKDKNNDLELLGVITEADILHGIEEILQGLRIAEEQAEEERKRQEEAVRLAKEEAAKPDIILVKSEEVDWARHAEVVKGAIAKKGAPYDDPEKILRGLEELLQGNDLLGLAFDQCRDGSQQQVFQVSEDQFLNPDENELWFFGDIHGDLLGMITAIEYAKKNSEGKEPMYFFLGDFTDRGPFDSLVLLKLYSMILDGEQRGRICVIAGNHDECLGYDEEKKEFYATVQPAEFTDWLNKDKKDDPVWQEIGIQTIEFFKRMPRAIFLPDGLLIAHGGVPHTDLHDQIESIKRLNDHDCLGDFVWTRAHEKIPKRRPNRNTRGCSFGREDFEAFCKTAGKFLDKPVDRMLRGHDHYLEGYRHYEKYVENPMLTLNTRCIQPDMMGGPYSNYLCVARWVPGKLPEVHKIEAREDILENVWTPPEEPAAEETPPEEPVVKETPADELSTPPEPTGGVKLGQLVLVGPDGRSSRIRVETVVGQKAARQFGEDARFWHEPQFKLKQLDEGWAVFHNPGAENETLLNGRAFIGGKLLKNGDQLAVGRESMGIIKLPFKVKIS